MYNLLKGKETKNALWLIGGKVIQMILSLVVGIFTARYLGPSNYGLVNYGTTYVSFFMSFCTLGINSVIIKDFFDHPEEQGKSIGTTLVLRIISSFASALMIVGIVGILDHNEPLTIVVVALCSISLLFHVFDTFNYYFQSKYRSKITAIATLIAYASTSVYKVILLITGASVAWFAFASSVDYIVLGILLYIFYVTNKGPRLSFSWEKGKALLKQSCHYILSGMMVAIYGQTDKLMLKQMLDTTAVGYYSTATAICAMWTFVLQAIIDSIYPTILKLKGQDEYLYERKNKQLYAITFYISIFVSVLFLLLGDFAIRILYGDAYAPAGLPLKIVTWYTAFSYLGVARNAWIVCEEKQKYLKYLYIVAAIMNVILNFIMIPFWGAAGAASASLITQIFSSIVLPLFIKGMKRNSILMLQAIVLYDVFGKPKQKINNNSGDAQ